MDEGKVHARNGMDFFLGKQETSKGQHDAPGKKSPCLHEKHRDQEKEIITQLSEALEGRITPAMEQVAQREGLSPERVRQWGDENVAE